MDKKKIPPENPLDSEQMVVKDEHHHLFLCIFSHFYVIPELYKFYFSSEIEHFDLKPFLEFVGADHLYLMSTWLKVNWFYSWEM